MNTLLWQMVGYSTDELHPVSDTDIVGYLTDEFPPLSNCWLRN